MAHERYNATNAAMLLIDHQAMHRGAHWRFRL